VYMGTLDGSSVCIKRVRVYAKGDPKKATRVCFNPVAFTVQHR